MTPIVSRLRVTAIVAVLAGVVPAASAAQMAGVYAPSLPDETMAPPVPREFRGVWIATVDNIDWPSRPGLPVDSAKAELVALLDRAIWLNLNAVIFQVRTAADALYRSELEPWSVYLTGRSGRAPSPAWDPLAFALAEAHRRGLELHAWFNPYRARYRGDSGPLSTKHVSTTMAPVVKRYGPYLWMDPGEPSVRAHTLKVILDVVKRYDIDGVHIDDYFYPYPERDRRGREIPFPDATSWNKYVKGGGKLGRQDWRRQNVDLLVEALYKGIKDTKPSVKFGISPFGIWRPGYPASVRGLDAYQSLYADSRRWLNEGWADYFVPQLYWQVRAPAQSYPTLLAWWAEQNGHGRHLWPGNGTFKVTDAGSARWPASEVVSQIQATRDQPGASGNVHFNMTALVRSSDALADRLATGPYAALALVPASPWLSAANPSSPSVRASPGDRRLALSITSAVAVDRTAVSPPRWWLVRARYGDGWRALVVDAKTETVDVPASADGTLPDVVVVNAIDHAGVESEPVRVLGGLGGGLGPGR
jgi:uncharacterized lipoprotein YddW (UPF0748 family)